MTARFPGRRGRSEPISPSGVVDSGGGVTEAGARRPATTTGLAAGLYTLVAATQKASGFLVLIAFTRILTPAEYGQIALLTTVSGLLLMVMTLGLEPRIMFAYFRIDQGLEVYLRKAQHLSVIVPAICAATMSVLILVLPLHEPTMWVMTIVGSCLLAAGTTYPYAVLRSASRSLAYAAFALSILVVQVGGRVVFVAVLDWGPVGWAASDLLAGGLAVAIGPLVVRGLRGPQTGAVGPSFWSVAREGLPLIPHYLAQWGLSLSDRLVLAIFVSTAAVGIYSAVYQIAAVISLMLSEVNRAFMPSYARHRSGSLEVPALVRLHVRVTFAVFGVLFLIGFTAITLFFPEEYRSRNELYPALALGALAYGLYFIPMNGLTLIAGETSRAPAISLGALTVNLATNFALDGSLGLWGAVLATCLGYATLTGLAVIFGNRRRVIDWGATTRGQVPIALVCLALALLAGLASWEGVPRALGLCGVAALSALLVLSTGRGIHARKASDA